MPEGAEISDTEDNNPKYDADDPHRALDIDLDIPPTEDRRILRTKRYDINILHTNSNSNNNKEAIKNEEKPKRLKEHSEKKDKKKDKHKKEHKKKEDNTQDEPNLLGTPVKIVKEKHKKESHKKKDKERREKKERHSKRESKKGYEEACGISTPSKEVF